MAISKTTDRKVFYVPHEMSVEIDEFRFGKRIASEAEALRQLIEKGLEAAKAEGRGEDGARV